MALERNKVWEDFLHRGILGLFPGFTGHICCEEERLRSGGKVYRARFGAGGGRQIEKGGKAALSAVEDKFNEGSRHRNSKKSLRTRRTARIRYR